MKLKTIAIIFNLLITISFVFVFVMPALFLGWDYAGVFWRGNWYLGLVFIAVLGALNLYFGYNWKLFRALEDEDWPEVIAVLDKRIARRPTAGAVRMMCHACVLTSRQDRIRRLEGEIAAKRPALISGIVMILAIPALLSGNGDEIVAYFERHRDSADRSNKPWVEWGYAFGRMLQERLEDARSVLEALVKELKPGLLMGLSAYLLDAWARGNEEASQRIDGYRRAIREKYSPRDWTKLIERERSELHVLVLGPLVGDVQRWVYETSDRSAEQ